MPTTKGIKLSNWYAVAAVISTGLQMPELPGVEPMILLGQDMPHYPDPRYVLGSHSLTPTETVIQLTPLGHFIPSVETRMTQVDDDDNIDFVVRPKYVKEGVIKVGSFKIDRSIPKIFFD